jgi:hypothetical protein
MNAKKQIEQAIALPIAEPVLLTNSLLQSINPPQADIDIQWATECRRRLTEWRCSQYAAIPGETVF